MIATSSDKQGRAGGRQNRGSDAGPVRAGSAEVARPRRWLMACDCVAANVLAVLIPFLVFRYVMLTAFQTFNLRVSGDEILRNLPAVLRQDMVWALFIGHVLTAADLLALRRRGRLRLAAKVVSAVSLPLVVVLVSGLYMVYLNLGFFPPLLTIREYLAPGSPLLKTAGTFLTPENTALVAVLIVFPLAVKLACRRYVPLARSLGLVFVALLIAGRVWPMPQTLARAGVHPLGQIYDGLVRTTPEWDLDRWARQPISYTSISGTYAAESFPELSGAFADHNLLVLLMESTSRVYLCDEEGNWKYPNLARLAEAGVDFTRYQTPGDASLSSLFALFASRLAVPLRCSRWYYPSDGRILWPAELKRRGYRIGFFHANSFDAWFNRRLFEAMGWDAFEDAGGIAYRYGVDPDSSSRLGEVVDERLLVRRVTEWIDESRRAGQRFFACYRNGIPHLPYDFRSRSEYAVHRGPRLTRRQAYENELAYVDAMVGELYDRLVADGFFENGVLLLTADHGEAFGQHPGVVVHSTHVYDENMHVPLLVVNPNRLSGLVNANPGSHVDFWPTLADLMGVELPDDAQGRSLLRPADRQMVFLASVENDVKIGVVDGWYKYIYERRPGRGELFDLRNDPGETSDVSDQYPGRARAYRDWLHTYVARELAGRRDGEALALETHVNLGYEFLRFDNLDAAHSHFAEALEVDTNCLDARIGLATVLTRQRRPTEAIELLQGVSDRSPDARVHATLAAAQVAAGRPDDALRQCKQALELDPGHPGVRTYMGKALAAAGRLDEGVAAFRSALAARPADAEAHECLGRLLLAGGYRQEGLEHLRACLRIDPQRRNDGGFPLAAAEATDTPALGESPDRDEDD